jgi:tRNA U34 2-thiouridine synthase MnmA/TrmU
MKTGRPAGKTGSKTSTRPLRRKTVLEIIGALSGIMDLEAEYRDSIPEQFAQRYEAADHACERLAEAVACLEDAF